VLRVRLPEEIRGRDEATETARRKAAGLPACMAFDSWRAFMPTTLATAAVDRLLHHAHVIVTEGASPRHAYAAAGRGVKPPAPTSREINGPSTGRSCGCREGERMSARREVQVFLDTGR